MCVRRCSVDSAHPTALDLDVQVNEGKVVAVGAGRRDKDGKPIPMGAPDISPMRDCAASRARRDWRHLY